MRFCKDCAHLFHKFRCLHPTNIEVDAVDGTKRPRVTAERYRSRGGAWCGEAAVYFEPRKRPTTLLGHIKEFFVR